MELFLSVTGITLGLMLLCGGIQWTLASRTTRKARLLPLPILWGAVCQYVALRLWTTTGWGVLVWDVLLVCAVCVLFGTMIGWVIGESRRKKREREAALPKEE